MSIYRQAPTLPYLCPRCGDVLDHVFELVRVCMACEGVWLERDVAQQVTAAAMSGGRSMWWRNTLECPECKLSNTSTQLTATSVGDLMIDRCPDGHGVFLDHGELGRLMRTESDELLTLLDLLANVDGTQVAARRESWKRARDERRALIAKHGAYLAELSRKQQEARAAEAAANATAERAARMQAEARRVASLDTVQRAAERERWRVQRGELQREQERLTKVITTGRLQIINAEAALAAQRELQARLEADAAAVVERIAEVDRELASLGS